MAITAPATAIKVRAAALCALIFLTGCSVTAARSLIGALSFARIYASDPDLLFGELGAQFSAPFTLDTVPAKALIDDVTAGRVEGAVVRDVPFYLQTRYGCGPSALASALAHCGVPVDLAEITHAVVMPKIGGTFTTDMVIYPRTRGLRSEGRYGTVEDLCRHLRAGRPVICLLGTGSSGFAGHYVCVSACAPGRGVVCHSGRRPGHFMRWKLFDALWSASERWMMMVSRPDDENWPAPPGGEPGRAQALLAELAAGHTEGAFVKDVPFYKQSLYGRGPSALASALAHCGATVDLEEITRSVVVPELGGTLFTDMVAHAHSRGFWSEARPGSVEKLRTHLRAGRPVICLLRPDPTGLSDYYICVSACAPGRGIVCHDGLGPDRFMDWERFENLWSASGRLMLVVCRPEDVNWPIPPGRKETLARVLHHAGRTEEAIREYEAALETETDDSRKSRITYSLGLARFALSQLKQARAAFEQAAKLDPDFPDAANALAFTCATLGVKLKEAESLARRALKAAPEQAALFLDTLGFVLHRQGRDAEAVKVLREALTKAAPGDSKRLTEIYYHLGLAYGLDAKGREAALRKAAELAPQSSAGRRAAALLKQHGKKPPKSP